MRTRFISFILFQLIAWILYFNWDMPGVNRPATAEMLLDVAEISPQNVSNSFAFKNNYKLILRNDGFFTRINQDQTFESGLWKVDYELPALILTSPKGDNHYQIITNYKERMHVREINTGTDYARNLTETIDLNLLFSSSALLP